MTNTRILWIHNLSPIHVGCGAGTGAIDLPIIREKTTNWPFIPGSSIKGVLADHFGASEPGSREDLAKIAFGKPDSKVAAGQPTAGNSGGLDIGDARLVCFPMKSSFGTFAWITCPLALQRLARDLKEMGMPAKQVPDVVPPPPEKLHVHDLNSTALRPPGAGAAPVRAALGEFDFILEQPADVAPLRKWAENLASWLFPAAPQGNNPWRSLFLKRFAMVDDDAFSYFNEHETEVDPRVRIDPSTGTVMKGQLWTEESLPPESILASFVWVDPIVTRVHGAKKTQELLTEYCSRNLTLQIGGNSTVGAGLSHVIFTGSTAAQTGGAHGA